MSAIPATGGRPKTPRTHEEDAILRYFDVRARWAAYMRMKQDHYRRERDEMHEIDEMLRDAAISSRFAEIAQLQQGAAVREGA